MAHKIGIFSDVHARPEPVRQALAIFAQEYVDEIICAGDIAGYYDNLEQTVELLKQAHCRTVVGNHDLSYLAAHAEQLSPVISYLQGLPEKLVFHVAGKSVYVVHAEPPDALHGGIKLLDQQGDIIAQQKQQWQAALTDFDHDILIVGHTHQVYAEQLGNTFVINPGSTAFNHSCMVLELPGKKLHTFALGEQPMIKCWNFSRLYGAKGEYPTDRKSKNLRGRV
jgi:putative phosphoesterase